MNIPQIKIVLLYHLMFYGLFFFLNFPNLKAHPLHVSTTEINYNIENLSLEIAIKVFAEDIESALETVGQYRIYSNLAKKEKQKEQLMITYLNKHFIVWINQKKQDLGYIGHEYEDEFIWFYVEIQNIDVDEIMTIQQTIFMDLFPDQSNHIYYSREEIKKTFVFNRYKIKAKWAL